MTVITKTNFGLKPDPNWAMREPLRKAQYSVARNISATERDPNAWNLPKAALEDMWIEIKD